MTSEAARLVPDWPAPPQVHAVFTTRAGGLSAGRFSAPEGGGLNLGLGSGDERAVVLANRASLTRGLPAAPAWLRQVHGSRVVKAAHDDDTVVEADASWTDEPGRVCAVLVADCLPVLFCNRAGTRVAAAHAGWRGLCAGILEGTVEAAGFDAADTIAWLGPAIGPSAFEVGDEVRDAFVAAAGATCDDVAAAFAPHGPGKWLADLRTLARIRLAKVGIRVIHASDRCTVADAARFYSYRRDGVTGRMAALIWLADPSVPTTRREAGAALQRP